MKTPSYNLASARSACVGHNFLLSQSTFQVLCQAHGETVTCQRLKDIEGAEEKTEVV